MKSQITILFLFSINLFSYCNNTNKLGKQENISQSETFYPENSNNKNPIKEDKKSIPKNARPIFGYRFIITGDFDGDKKNEKLIEHFYSGLSNKETDKFYEGIDYGQLIELTIRKKPVSFVSSDNRNIDTLHISSGGQLLGLSYLKNEGDLNEDGTDEISYVINWADESNLNTWHIMTYKNKKWVEIYSFDIWDWQLPNLPGTFNHYNLFGLAEKDVISQNDSLNILLEKKLNTFNGLVKKISKSKIQIIYMSENANLDTSIIDIK